MKEENRNLRKVSMDEILEAQRRDMVEKEEVERKKNMLRHERGLPPHMPDMGLDDFAWSQFEVNICPTTPIFLSLKLHCVHQSCPEIVGFDTGTFHCILV